ncbi:FemAB family XrtA/PEP-CTERM system-associated protein [Desulfoluna sp.]|uniref:FemAB family XrtA/PEP-CTERM system-associated protein n=1 Tax=Desulfoluna sp. TaxID=2045199 RepID=UPI002612F86E|nr:FemAB family XrtA/PEP-CTERM system-associated protein [Desulfoluna sp.]
MQIVTTDLDQDSEKEAWNHYVSHHECGSLYVRAEWGDVIRDVYGHDSIRLVAVGGGEGLKKIVGVLPMVHMRSRIFGNRLISMPYFDVGGAVADTPEIEEALMFKALDIGRTLGVKSLEIRQVRPIAALDDQADGRHEDRGNTLSVFKEKERMLLALPPSSESLWTSFKSKLRSQIRRAMKEGLTVDMGDEELIDTFYTVFAENMRDLGSPVHAKALFHGVMNAFKGRAKIVVVKKGGMPVAASIVCPHGKTLQNPWASSLRRYSRLSPNMLLYWAMLEYASDHRYSTFDFGRSTSGEGTYRFKKQWGAEPRPLHWYQWMCNNVSVGKTIRSDKDRFGRAAKYWQKLPVSVTTLLGPMVRGQISL